jgi:hypothetical protein
MPAPVPFKRTGSANACIRIKAQVVQIVFVATKPVFAGTLLRLRSFLGNTRATGVHSGRAQVSNMEELRQDLCFVCERVFAPAEAPAETWAAGAEGEHIVHVCRECVRNPPSVPPPSLDSLPDALRQPLTMHLGSLVMRHRSRHVRQAAPPPPNGAPMQSRAPESRLHALRGRIRHLLGDLPPQP